MIIFTIITYHSVLLSIFSFISFNTENFPHQIFAYQNIYQPDLYQQEDKGHHNRKSRAPKIAFFLHRQNGKVY